MYRVSGQRDIRFNLAILLFSISIGLLSAGVAEGQTYYFSTSGDDADPGTEAFPKKSLSAAADLIVPGTNIRLKRGDTWNQGSTTWEIKDKLGTVANPIVIESYGTGPKPVIRMNAGPRALFVKNISNTTIRDLRFEGANQTVIHALVPTTNVTLSNLDVRQFDGSGIKFVNYFGGTPYFPGQHTNFVLEDSVVNKDWSESKNVFGVEPTGDSVLVIKGNGGAIRKNVFVDNGHTGIGLYATNDFIVEENDISNPTSNYGRGFALQRGSVNNTLRRNKFNNLTQASHLLGNDNQIYGNLFTNFKAIGWTYKRGPYAIDLVSFKGNTARGNIIANNTFYGIPKAGIRLNGDKEIFANTFANNLFVNFAEDPSLGPGYAIWIQNVAKHQIVQNNNFWNGQTDNDVYFQENWKSTATEANTWPNASGNLQIDPQLLGPENGIYILGPNSLLLNAGIPLPVLGADFTDYNGNAWGGNPAIGAYGALSTRVATDPGSSPLVELDSDGDSILDGQDAFPDDPAEWQDTDNDDIGNNVDPDDDNDGLPDDWEIQYDLDPLQSNDAASDLDGDTLSNLEEFNLNTNPALTDTDVDGVDDNFDHYPTDSARSRENNSPVAMDDNASTGEGMAITIDLVSNDTDSDGDILTIASVDNASANSGVIVNNEDGTITYTPASDFSGDDDFSYTVSDGNGADDTAMVTVAVTSAPTPGGTSDGGTSGDGSNSGGSSGENSKEEAGAGSFNLYALLLLLLGGVLRLVANFIFPASNKEERAQNNLII
jgi:hypothetical protein